MRKSIKTDHPVAHSATANQILAGITSLEFEDQAYRKDLVASRASSLPAEGPNSLANTETLGRRVRASAGEWLEHLVEEVAAAWVVSSSPVGLPCTCPPIPDQIYLLPRNAGIPDRAIALLLHLRSSRVYPFEYSP